MNLPPDKHVSLKVKTEANSEMNKQFLNAVENLKNGKWNAKRRLYKYVKCGHISYKRYEELIEEYGRREERREQLRAYMFLLYIISISVAAYILGDSCTTPWVSFSYLYLGCCFSFYFVSNSSNKEHQNRKISQLEQEIRQLERMRESDKDYIKFLEKQLEDQNNEFKD